MIDGARPMPRITRVYTRTGDDGTTALGDGSRVAKDAPRVAAYGTVDELNSQLGTVLAAGVDERLQAPLRRIQNELFHLGAELCLPADGAARPAGPRLAAAQVRALEELMDALAAHLEPLANFVLPGGAPGAAALHVARAVCRRAERELVALGRGEPVGEWTVVYLNRLSDALFVMARFENRAKGIAEPLWDSRA
jgi:cob(I)alamin adenosyltransferase